MDPQTLQSVDISAQVYWRAAFEALAGVTDLVEFTVLDIEPSGPIHGKWVLADAQVAVNAAFKSSSLSTNTAFDSGDTNMDYDDTDDNSNNQIFHTRTHLGGILQPGDAVLGYHLTRANFNSDSYAALEAICLGVGGKGSGKVGMSGVIPDVILVRKTYPNRRKKNRTRNWRLKSIAKETGESAGADEESAGGAVGGGRAGKGGRNARAGAAGGANGVIGRMGGRDQRKVEEDYELFLRDIEEDEEMRAAVNLYKASGGTDKMGAGSGLAGGKTRRKAKAGVDGGGSMDIDMDEEHAVHHDTIHSEQHMGNVGENVDVDETDEEEEEEEADFPEVRLDELLDDFDEMTLQESEDN